MHVIRDGRDVVTSLLERGWLSAERSGEDDARLAFGSHARFWVEPGREDEFARVSDATRAAWAWRRYVTAAAAVPERTVEVRYEQLVTDPAAAADRSPRRLASTKVSSQRRSRAYTSAQPGVGGATCRRSSSRTSSARRAPTLVALGYELSSAPP